jgi:hypothetical protein
MQHNDPIFNPYEGNRFSGEIPLLDSDIDNLGEYGAFHLGRVSPLDLI